MSLYSKLKTSPPILRVEGEVREIKIDLVSVMCDNKYRWIARKNSEGDFKIHTRGYAFSNFNIPRHKDDIEWAMDHGDWEGVFALINEGTVVVHKIQYR